MLRTDISAQAARAAREEERIVVVPGESKVSCGAHVVLETGSLEGAFAIGVFDVEKHVGGLLVSRWPLAGGEGTVDPARELPVLIESAARLGARRAVLRFVTAGEGGVLDLLSPALADQS
ncbi:MAG: hypothetical protein ACF8XB_10165, partial [Planctomycetota bacterium JB042]